MAKRWVENTSATPTVIGGRLLQKGEGHFVNDGPLSSPPLPVPVSYDASKSSLVGPTGEILSPVSSAGNSSFQAVGSKVGAFSIDLSLGPNVSFTSTGAITPTFTNTPALNTAQRCVLTITNGGAGVVTWPAGTRWMGPGVVGSAPSLAASGTEKVVIDIINNAGALSYDASYLGRVA